MYKPYLGEDVAVDLLEFTKPNGGSHVRVAPDKLVGLQNGSSHPARGRWVRWPRYVLMAFALAVLAGTALWLSSVRTGNKAAIPGEPPRVAVVQRGPLQARVVETGTLEPARTIDIKSQFSGEIRKVLVAANDLVSATQPLVVIQQESSQARQAAQLRTSIDEEQVNLDLARLESDRMRTLYEREFVSQKELQTAEQHYQQAQLRLALAKRQLLLALGGNRELYQRYLTRAQSDGLVEFIVLSPSAGTIIELKVHPGELITSGTFSYGGGTVLMRLADLTRMVVKAKVNEVNIVRVKVGQTVEIRLDALPGLQFQGEVVSIAAGGEKENNMVTYLVTISVDNSDNILRPMMTANVDIVTDVLSDTLHIPLEAVRLEKGEDMVDLLSNGVPVRHKVRVGLRTESEAVIVHGLQEGDQVTIPNARKTHP